MRYFATASTDRIREAMRAGRLGQIITPAAGNRLEPTAEWIADNSVFADHYPGDARYLMWLDAHAPFRATCRFATAPDVVGNHTATLARSLHMLPKIRRTIGNVAFIAQNGANISNVPWRKFDTLFIGGDTPWKLGAEAASLAAEAKRLGKWVHMGRVNSLRRLHIASAMGCDSVDGTYLAFGPDINLPKMLRWLGQVNGA